MRSKKKTSLKTESQTPKKWTSSKPAQAYYVKCIYHTRIVIIDAPSGQRYDFQPGATQLVKAEDYQFLLSKQREAGGQCCNSTPGVIRYFEEA